MVYMRLKSEELSMIDSFGSFCSGVESSLAIECIECVSLRQNPLVGSTINTGKLSLALSLSLPRDSRESDRDVD